MIPNRKTHHKYIRLKDEYTVLSSSHFFFHFTQPLLKSFPAMTIPKAVVINIWEAWPPFSIKMPTEIMPKSANLAKLDCCH